MLKVQMYKLVLILALLGACAVHGEAAVRLYARTTQPATCNVGDYWVDTDGTAGEKFYICEATNTWVRQVGYGTGSNPSFNSVHASGGNLAAANKQVTKAWQTGLSYTADVTSVIHGGKHWIAKTNHTAGSTTEPGVGASYTDAWAEVTGGSMSWPASDGAYYAAKDGAWASLSSVYQPLDSDLTAFAGLTCSENQIPKRNASNTWVCGSDNEGAGGGISHATSDGNYYASRNGAWASLTGLYAAALGADDNYVTDAEKTKLSNLSGTNTGDQVLPTDATITTTDVTTNNASTTKHGWLLKATAPASGLRNVVAIDNAETVYTNKALFDATSPSTQAFGDAAAVGTAMTSARRDHKHAMPAAPTTITGNAGTATALAANGTNCSAGQAALGVDASGNAEGCWTPSGSSAAGSNTQVQFNDGGTSFGGDAGLTYNKTTDSLTVVGTVTAGNFSSSAADGARYSEIPNTVTLTSTATLGRIAWLTDRYWLANGTNWTSRWLLDSSMIGAASGVQGYDTDLAALAAPTAWRLYYSNGSSAQTALAFGAANTFFISGGASSAPSFYNMTTSINSGAPNGAGAKIHWSQLTGVPAGFADGSDDGTGGGITHATSDGTYYASRNGAWSAFTSGNYTLSMTLSGNTAVTLPTSGTLATTVASGTSALGTSAISSGACATAVTTSATGVATTDVINWGFNGDPTGVTGYAPSANGMLTIIAYPSANNVNYKVCNNTASSITPGAITLNWRVNR